MQIRSKDCDIKKLRSLRKECLKNDENLVILLDSNDIKKGSDLEDPGQMDIRISQDYFFIPDAVLYVSPKGALKVIKNGN